MCASEFVGHADVDVAFEQRFADSREGGVQMLFGELALAAQILEDALELVCQVLKHGLDDTRLQKIGGLSRSVWKF